MAKGKSVTYDNKVFGSIYEVARYLRLKQMQQDGEIHHLVCHPSYSLVPPIEGFTVISQIYKRGTALPELKAEFDFEYFKDGKLVVEDVKADGVFFPLKKDGKPNKSKRGWLLEPVFLVKLKFFLWMKEPEGWDFLIPEITKEELKNAKDIIVSSGENIGKPEKKNRRKIR